jgi:hypothetical protein
MVGTRQGGLDSSPPDDRLIPVGLSRDDVRELMADASARGYGFGYRAAQLHARNRYWWQRLFSRDRPPNVSRLVFALYRKRYAHCGKARPDEFED